ncbi:MAG: hypothetical protein ACREFX_14820 [Opitutaceae bacterium]
MAKAKIESLPLDPEGRDCRAPATERILDLFQPLQLHCILRHGALLQTFQPQLDDLQRKVVQLRDIPLPLGVSNFILDLWRYMLFQKCGE